MFTRYLWTGCIAALLLGTQAHAADLQLPKPAVMKAMHKSPVDVPVQAYGSINPACAEWTDGCVVCAKGNCSTAGIACLPKEIVCRRAK